MSVFYSGKASIHTKVTLLDAIKSHIYCRSREFYTNGGDHVNKNKLKLTSSEIGSLWGEYVNGTMADVVNRYMFSIIEDKSIKKLFDDAIKAFAKQKNQIAIFMENDGFPVPIGFTEDDLNKGAERLFTNTFCLNYLHIMTLHGLLGHTTSLGVSARKDLRYFYDSCNDDGKRMYHQTTELMLEKGIFQRDPLFYPTKKPEFVSNQDFMDGILQKEDV